MAQRFWQRGESGWVPDSAHSTCMSWYVLELARDRSTHVRTFALFSLDCFRTFSLSSSSSFFFKYNISIILMISNSSLPSSSSSFLYMWLLRIPTRRGGPAGPAARPSRCCGAGTTAARAGAWPATHARRTACRVTAPASTACAGTMAPRRPTPTAALAARGQTAWQHRQRMQQARLAPMTTAPWSC